jgi:TM2 domain-containing membrane protein YozV
MGATFGRKGIEGGAGAPRRAAAFGNAVRAGGATPLSLGDELALKREAFLAAERARRGHAPPAPATADAGESAPAAPVRSLAEMFPRFHFSNDFSGKSYPVAFALWFFLGIAGAHRFYLDRPITGGVQLALFLTGILFVALQHYAAFGVLVACMLWMVADGRLISRVAKARG